VWTGGGIAFGPTPRHYTFKINRKERQAALRCALSVHAERDSLAVFDASKFDAPSTSQAAELLADWGGTVPTLVVLTDDEISAGKSFRNLARVVALPVSQTGVADLIGAASLLVSETALPALVARAVARKREDAAQAPAPAAAKRNPPPAAKAAEPEAAESEAAEPEAAQPEAAEPEAAEPEAAEAGEAED
jgi:large subunit ribosomal protein L4